MYINDVHIFTYLIVLVIGFLVGHTIELINNKISKSQKIFEDRTIREIIKKLLIWKKINYINGSIVALLYVISLYRYGIKPEFIENISLIKAFVLIPILIAVIQIDYKSKIIPNRLTLLIFESGLIFTFIYSANNLFMARDYFLAMLVGLAIYGIIAILGRIIAGKEAMGMGDIKLLASLGLYFGIPLTISISVISFIIAGIMSIAYIILKKNKNNEYISFGPSIAISAIICIIIPENQIISLLLTIFTLGKYKIK